MLTSVSPHIGIVPVYVSYFEELDPRLAEKKEAFAGSVVSALERASAGSLRITASPVARTVEEAHTESTKLTAAGVDALVVIPLIAAFGELLLAASGDGTLPVL